ncbi:MAG: hypothetical protein LBQ89_08260 [Treponema sp.]|jgi:hypothetical protein|nr:hypothetical protein [Treponema sp.]
MNVTVNRNPSPPRQEPVQPPPTPLGKQFGAWGRVHALHSEDNTVDVYLDIGVYLQRVPVASKEWVIFGEDREKDFNSGERDLPPIQARVFIFMPTFTFNDCFVAPFSGFNTIDKNTSEPFFAEEKEPIKERITPIRWHITNDYISGSHKSISPDKKTSLEINYGYQDEPLDPPELHAQLFHDEENDDPGIKLDVVSGETVDVNIFNDIKLHHKKEDVITGDFFEGEVNYAHTKNDSVVLRIFDTEITIKKGLVNIVHDGNWEEAIKGNFTSTVDGNYLLKVKGVGMIDVDQTLWIFGHPIRENE